MAEDDGGGTTNPYARQTAANTDPARLGDGRKVDVDLDGLAEYAKHMQDTQFDLLGRIPKLRHLLAMPNAAWEGAVLGEAAYVRHTMISNAGELTRYLQNLAAAVNNIGMAAQTVADIYASSDTSSAQSLDAVKFAFGDQNVPRPPGVPDWVGKTYWESVWEERAKAGAPPLPADSDAWSAPTETSTPYQNTQVSVATNGQRREIVTTHVPGSSMVVVTTTVYGPDNKILATSSERTTTYTTTGANGGATTVHTSTESSRDGKVTGTSDRSTTYVGGKEVEEVATSKDPNGTRTGETRETVGADGSTTTTTTNGKGEVTDQVVIGPQTEGQLTPDKPLAAQHSPGVPG